MAIELRNVTYQYPGGHVAVRDVSLSIAQGERVAIIGRNGAGKTTVVKLMNALNRPTAGDVLVDGEDIKKRTTAQVARTVGYVFQNPDDQIFNKDVITELEYMPRYFRLPEAEVRRRVGRAVELTQIGAYLKQSPYDIPYPIRKLVTIAAVLATEPGYLILDEPTAGQDGHGTGILKRLAAQLQTEGVGVITITHDMEFASMFPRVIVMAHANVIADGAPREVFWNESVLPQAGIKKPQLAQLAAELELGGRLLYCGEVVDELTKGVKP